MRRASTLLTLPLGIATLAAEEVVVPDTPLPEDAAVVAPAAAPAPVPSPWSHSATVRLQANMVESDRAAASRDPTIGGTNDSMNWRAGFEGSLDWEIERHQVLQSLDLAFGRERNDDEQWQESVDEIVYDGAYNWKLGGYHRPYGAAVAESVFTGAEPDEEPLDPFLLKISAGYGQEFEDLLPETDRLMWRAGVRAQRRWGDGLSEHEREWEFGPEARIRYQRQQTEHLSYHAQYDVFSEFNDMGHVTHLLQAGLEAQLTSLLAVTLTGRAYYEGEPEDAENGAIGYDEWSWRQETLVGLVYEF